MVVGSNTPLSIIPARRIGLEYLNADLVNPSRAPVALDVLERLTHKFRGDSTSKRMGFTCFNLFPPQNIQPRHLVA